MKIPKALEPLIEDGIIDGVVRQLKSGKEASVFTVSANGDVRCAKVYKDMAHRSFQARTSYQEGRKVRGSRQARAIAKSTKFGKREQEEQWKSTEADVLYQLYAAGVCVPKPFGFFNGVLLMELITDTEGYSAPRLGEVELSADQAQNFYRQLINDVVRMLCLGFIHGDLSEYNVLVSERGPIIIDFPQTVSAAGNQAARAMLLRDVHNIRDTLARFAPELAALHHGEEMWALYQQGSLNADTQLTGEFVFDTHTADVRAVEWAIEDARQVAMIREQGRLQAEQE
jgi:RIO kinase 1